MDGADDIVLPFPRPRAALGQATLVRSTLLASSRESLRRRGVFDRYEALLSPPHRDVLGATVAGQWLPVDVGRAHYEACDGLGFTVEEQVAIGAEVSQQVHNTFLGVLVRMARNVGVTPWTLLPRGNQLYGRLFDGGGGVCIRRLGAKEVRAEIAGVPLLEVPYFRQAVRGLYQEAVGLFCAKAYARELADQATPTSVALRLWWS